MMICTRRRDDWAWATWLPHLASSDGPRVAVDSTSAAQLLEGANVVTAPMPMSNKRPNGPVHLVVADEPKWFEGVASPLRAIVTDPAVRVRAIVIAATLQQVPACATQVVFVDGPSGELHTPSTGANVNGVALGRLDVGEADSVARSLACLDDADLATTSAALDRAALPEILAFDVESIQRRWATADPARSALAVVGVDAFGPVTIDLVNDGPHALIAGTTGAGKSELLRTLVCALCAATDSEHLNVILIDFKGGGAFGALAVLPHVVGVVTDLDPYLSARALSCLKAELRRREHLLADAGVDDLPAYLRGGHDADEPIARLVVVIDEFATLVSELPGFVGSLVDVAQRGRSLGIHLVLATQRPAGVVDNKIKANTNLRIALRLQDDMDSFDVIDVADAAKLPRKLPGRAIARLGSNERRTFQTAIARDLAAEDHQMLTVSPADVWNATRPRGRTMLETSHQLVANIALAAQGLRPARVPWPQPLPDTVTELPDPDGTNIVGLVDLPDEQRLGPWSWTPADGNLAIITGDLDDAATTALTIASLTAQRNAPREMHLHLVDGSVGKLATLETFPHVGTSIRADQPSSLRRLLELLNRELDHRSTNPHQIERPAVVVVIDGFSGVTESMEAVADLSIQQLLTRLLRDGPALGITTMATASTERAIPMRYMGLFAHRLVGQLMDPAAYGFLGLKTAELPTFQRGRFIDLATNHVVQIASLAAEAPRSTAAPDPRRIIVKLLGDRVAATDLDYDNSQLGDTWQLPIGWDQVCATQNLVLPPGIDALVAGPPRSGRTTTVKQIARAAQRLGAQVVAVANPLDGVDQWCSTIEQLTELSAVTSPTLVAIDDIETIDQTWTAALNALIVNRPKHLRIVVTGRGDNLRNAISWCAPLRAGRTGILLAPSGMDGDVLKTVLPPRLPTTWPPGRGLLFNLGTMANVQVAVGSS
jgi:DNA segregation ATPase FtsK/SpoIIIE, S-DNA-T family